MKKFLAIFICLIMAFSTVAMASPDESTEQILKDFYNTHKDILFLDPNVKVEVAFLADVDNDNEPELLISAGTYFHGLSIYKVKDGMAKLHETITCERGTGINENFGFLIADDGRVYLFKAKTDAQIPSDYTIYTYTLYNLGKSFDEPASYLSVNIPTGEGAEEAYYTDVNGEKTVTPVSEAVEGIEWLKSTLASRALWSRDENSNYIDLETIWNKQKVLNGDTSVTVTLQIGNPIVWIHHGLVSDDTELIPPGGSIVVDEVPVIKNGRTLVPEEVVEALGGTIYKRSNGEIAVGFKNNAIYLVPESNIAFYNENEITLDAAPTIINGTTMFPVRFIAETFGAVVEWDGAIKQVTITKN